MLIDSCLRIPLASLALALSGCGSGKETAADPDTAGPEDPPDATGIEGEPEAGPPEVPMITGNFSFFVTSVESMRALSGSEDGFGGNLGGLAGADEICQTIAANEGAGHKTWRAFLSATTGGEGGGPVHAIDRIGEGPWYDRLGRLVATDRASLVSGDRPAADPVIASSLPNERGEPLGQNDVDDHDIMTGSSAQGMLFDPDPQRTCMDWTSTETTATLPEITLGDVTFAINGPMCGHAWPAFSGQGWAQAHPAPGCGAGAILEQLGPPQSGSDVVGGGGGYGGIYCFALTP